KLFIINDCFWITLGILACIGGLQLGVGTVSSPYAGFMPFILGILLSVLALLDLITGLKGEWQRLFGAAYFEKGFWVEVKLTNVITTMVALFIYAAFFETVGFIIMTFLLFSFFFRVYAPRPWWRICIDSVIFTFGIYMVFKMALKIQLPAGYFGITSY
ncbi:MAG: tripartite tricarboxylate transporter TctB family protein, partial [Pseudomonadota bacterium]